mmetsp:Transcript_23174/g.35772  ORF Transcript_23174/g.35772 Transcript_23174/m.35772 type:complete len:224 (-) Transcript_23174:766-1437(-)
MSQTYAPHDETKDHESLLLMGRLQLFARVLTNVTTETEVTLSGGTLKSSLMLSHEVIHELEDLRVDIICHKTIWFDGIFCDIAERQRINDGLWPFSIAALVLCTIHLEHLQSMESEAQSQTILFEHILLGTKINKRCTLIYVTHWLTSEMKRSFLQYSNRWNLAAASAYNHIGDIGNCEERLQQAKRLEEEFEALCTNPLQDIGAPSLPDSNESSYPQFQMSL